MEDEIGVVDADLNGNGYIDEKDTGLARKLLVGLIDQNGAHIKGAPTYTNEDDEMRLAAYVAPEYNAATIASALSTYASAGFTTIIGENRVMYGDANFDAYMKAAKNAGLDVLVQAGSIQLMAQGTNSVNTEIIQAQINALKEYDNFRGLFMGDEPKIAQYDSYKSVTNILKTLNKDMDLFIANLPIYTTDETNLSSDNSLSLNEKYAAYASAYGAVFNEFNYDFYPFKHSYKTFWGSKYNEQDYMQSGWFNNLEIAAQTAHGLYDTGITVQSYAEAINPKDHYREVTKEDVSFQVYSALAYGVKSISYVTYDEHGDAEVGTTNCMIYDGQTTGIYDAVKAINKEIKALDHMLLKFAWQGTIGISGDNEDKIMDCIIEKKYTSKRISAYTASNDAIIGCLRDENGYDGFMLVNATDPSDGKDVDVSVTFNSANRAKVYINGVESDVALNNGTYSATLTPGQGIFVIPYNE